MTPRVVFDTTTVVSALLFRNGRLSWLVPHWENGDCTPLLSKVTAGELMRVLAYPKFHLTTEDQNELMAHYVPMCEVVGTPGVCPIVCRDQNDQPFLDLATSGNADLLITGDKDLLVLAGETAFEIISPEVYRQRVIG